MIYKGWDNFDAGKHQARVLERMRPKLGGTNLLSVSVEPAAIRIVGPITTTEGGMRYPENWQTSHTYEFQLTPVPKPRQTQQDKWKQRPAVMAYRAFADELRAQAEAQGFVLPDCGWSVSFHLPMPPSWSAKKRAAMFGQPHQSKPDLDNLLKALKDSLRADDSPIWEITGLRKYWSDVGRIIVRMET